MADLKIERWNCSDGWSKKLRAPGGRSTDPLSSTAYINVKSDADLEGGENVDAYQCFNDGINILFLDGHVEWLPLEKETEMQDVIAKLVVSEGLESYVDE